MKKAQLYYLLELAFVLVVVTAMLVYGLGKYLQFESSSHSEQRVSQMTGMELMWAFYGYSKTYPMLLGIAELAGAGLFLFRRTRVLGGLLLSAILLNVIVQDVIYGVNRGALIAASIYQTMVFAVLWLHRGRLWAGIRAMTQRENPIHATAKSQWIGIAGAIALAALLKVLEIKLTHGG